jgi:hypothetical protein
VTTPELTDVVVHRKATKSPGENVYRVVLEVSITDQSTSLDAWKAVITTPQAGVEPTQWRARIWWKCLIAIWHEYQRPILRLAGLPSA